MFRAGVHLSSLHPIGTHCGFKCVLRCLNVYARVLQRCIEFLSGNLKGLGELVLNERVADGGDGLQIWRVSINILNRQLRTAARCGPPAWGLGEGLITPHRKRTVCYEMLHRASDAEPCEHGNDPSDTWGISWITEWLWASQEWLCFMELVSWRQ
jgi:hypothetical protein